VMVPAVLAVVPLGLKSPPPGLVAELARLPLCLGGWLALDVHPAEEGKPVSAWLAEAATEKAQAAARHAAGRAAARELIADYEHDHGPLPAASRQRAREFLAEAGLLDDEPQRAAG